MTCTQESQCLLNGLTGQSWKVEEWTPVDMYLRTASPMEIMSASKTVRPRKPDLSRATEHSFFRS